MKKKTAFLSIIIAILLTSLLLSGCDFLFGENEPVIIASPPIKTAIVGKLYEYQPEIDVIARSKVTFFLNKAPQGMTIDVNTGLITWIPAEAQIGEHEVAIRVKNSRYYDDQLFTITVVNFQLKGIKVLPSIMSFDSISGSSQTIKSITAYYTDGTYKIIDNKQCEFKSNKASIVTVGDNGVVTAQGYGDTTITVSYTEEGITESDTITVKVDKPSTGGG